VIGITAASAIGGAGDGWTVAPCKQWFGLRQAR